MHTNIYHEFPMTHVALEINTPGAEKHEHGMALREQQATHGAQGQPGRRHQEKHIVCLNFIVVPP
jgi:hypothetical protein